MHPHTVLPTGSPSPSATEFFAKIGQQARLNCPRQPGRLFMQYYGQWSVNSTDIARIPAPSRSSSVPDFFSGARYSVNRSDFSLLIDNVSLSDSGSSYRCELLVEDPQDLTERHTFGESGDLELLVYGMSSCFSYCTYIGIGRQF